MNQQGGGGAFFSLLSRIIKRSDGGQGGLEHISSSTGLEFDSNRVVRQEGFLISWGGVWEHVRDFLIFFLIFFFSRYGTPFLGGRGVFWRLFCPQPSGEGRVLVFSDVTFHPENMGDFSHIREEKRKKKFFFLEQKRGHARPPPPRWDLDVWEKIKRIKVHVCGVGVDITLLIFYYHYC